MTEKKKEENKKNKSLAKAIGLKSVFVKGENLIMTSFGKGNHAVIEKKAKASGEIFEEKSPAKFEAEVKPANIDIKKHNSIASVVNNPKHYKDSTRVIGQDYLRLKEEIEKEIFGKIFPDDNIRIQLAYNIFDIKKILSAYINNIIYIFYNLQRQESSENDLLGYAINYKMSYEDHLSFQKNSKISENKKKSLKSLQEFMNKASDYFSYFGDIFEKNIDEKACENNFNVLRVLSMIRQFCMHGIGEKNHYLFNLEKNAPNELLSVIYKPFSKAVENINKNFIKTANNNMKILITILGVDRNNEEVLKELAQQFYIFSVLKDQNNLGLNIKKLREAIIENHYNDVKSHDHDSIRPKIYSLMDFILYIYLKTTKAEEIVEKLRATKNDDEKQAVYIDYADKIWESQKERLGNKLVNIINDVVKNNNNKSIIIKESWLNDVRIGSHTRHFSSAIYFMTKFLDGKEINELLSSMINKFENIQSYINVLKSLGEDIIFRKEYKLFSNNNCGEIASEMRVIKSLARMKDVVKVDKFVLYKEALNALGISFEKYKKNSEGKVIVDNEGNNSFTEEYINLFEQDKKNKYGNIIRKEGKTQKDHEIRNFIINNVIKSKRFFYITKYINPIKCPLLVKNKILTNFVLKTLPEAQIDRYYYGATLKKPEGKTFEEKVETLSEKIKNISFNFLFDIKKSNEEKERIKSIIGLYLTVVFLITKNMVKINSIYTIAFSCFERDNALYTKKIRGQENAKDYSFGLMKTPEGKPKSIVNFELLRYFIDDNRFKYRQKKYLKENMETSDSFICQIFRNNVVHLNAINKMYNYLDISYINSYFDLYHYIIQRILVEYNRIKNNILIKKYKPLIEKYKTYNKDFVKILNIPFGYNLPRYKNISINGLFNRMMYDDSITNKEYSKEKEGI